MTIAEGALDATFSALGIDAACLPARGGPVLAGDRVVPHGQGGER